MREYSAEPPHTFAAEFEGGVGRRLGELHLSARRLLVFTLLAMVFMLAARPITDPDFWWHLRTGRLIVETRAIPRADVFSATFAGREWVAHEWLSEVVMYAAHLAFGYGGLVVLFALVITAAMWLAYGLCARRAGHPHVAGLALLLGALTASPTWGVRPQMFTFLFASLFLVILDGHVSGNRRGRLWWLVPLSAVWANMHAGFAMGFALIALTAAGLFLDAWLGAGEGREPIWRRVRPLTLVFAACAAAASLNPNGPRLFLYPFETLTSGAMMKYIEEWHSPDFHQPMFLPLAVMLFATFAAMALSRGRVRPGALLLLVATGYGALRSGRNVPFFALAAMPLLAEHAWGWLARQGWGRNLAAPEKRAAGREAVLKVLLNVSLLVAVPLAVGLLRVQRVAAAQAADEARNFPAAAVEFVRGQRPPQPIYHEYGWGGYMIWKLYPDYRVYIDGRADVYGDAFLEEFLDTHTGGANWRAALDKAGVRTVVVAADIPLASLLRMDVSWDKVYEDEQAVIFVRR